MPIISITLPQKGFYIYKEDIVKIDKIADNKIKRDETYHKEDTSYWDQYDPYYKVTEYCFNVSWELLGLIGNRTVKLSNFFSEVEVQKFPYDFYYESTSSDNRSVFLSTWESTINPSLLYDFLERLSQSNLYIQLSGEDKQQVRKLIILGKTMLNYSVRLDLNREL